MYSSGEGRGRGYDIIFWPILASPNFWDQNVVLKISNVTNYNNIFKFKTKLYN